MTCPDCGVEEGRLHEEGCDQERCTRCLRQRISCDCPNHYIQERIPFVYVPVFCNFCGNKMSFPFWMTTIQEWQLYVPMNLLDSIICESCFNRLKKLFPTGWRNAS